MGGDIERKKHPNRTEDQKLIRSVKERLLRANPDLYLAGVIVIPLKPGEEQRIAENVIKTENVYLYVAPTKGVFNSDELNIFMSGLRYKSDASTKLFRSSGSKAYSTGFSPGRIPLAVISKEKEAITSTTNWSINRKTGQREKTIAEDSETKTITKIATGFNVIIFPTKETAKLIYLSDLKNKYHGFYNNEGLIIPYDIISLGFDMLSSSHTQFILRGITGMTPWEIDRIRIAVRSTQSILPDLADLYNARIQNRESDLDSIYHEAAMMYAKLYDDAIKEDDINTNSRAAKEYRRYLQMIKGLSKQQLTGLLSGITI